VRWLTLVEIVICAGSSYGFGDALVDTPLFMDYSSWKQIEMFRWDASFVFCVHIIIHLLGENMTFFAMLIAVCSINATAGVVVIKQSLSGSGSNCVEANRNLEMEIRSLSSKPSKIAISKCFGESKGVGYQFSQNAEVEFDVESVLGNF
jgi:hypothetical protein